MAERSGESGDDPESRLSIHSLLPCRHHSAFASAPLRDEESGFDPLRKHPLRFSIHPHRSRSGMKAEK